MQALRLDRLWNREPGWFLSLPRETQAQVLAEYRLSCETPEQAKAEAKRAKRAELDRRMRRYHG